MRDNTLDHAMSMTPTFAPFTGRMFMSVQEAAERLGVTEGWIYERTRRKTIPHRKLGKFVRFTEDDLRSISEAAARGALQ
jgi:excisionase family DNA binding protein